MACADVIVSKGMGNYETLEHEDIICFLIFHCKCDYFAARIEVPRLSGFVLHGPYNFTQ